MKNYIYIFIGICFLSLQSCDEDSFTQTVDIDIPDHESRLAISGIVSNRNPFMQTIVSASQSILDIESAPQVSNKNIQILVNGESIGNEVAENGNAQVFEVTTDLNAGDELIFEVSADNYGQARSTQVFPSSISVSDFEYEEDGIIDVNGDTRNEINISIDDPANEDNFYSLWFEYVYYKDQNIYSEFSYAETSGVGINEQYSEFVFSDGTFNGTKHSLRFSDYIWNSNAEEPDSVFIKSYLSHLSEDYYYYKTSYFQYSQAQGNPFAEPVIVHDNIENGYGIFGAENVTIDSLRIK